MEKLFFNKGLISGLIFFWTGRPTIFLRRNMFIFFHTNLLCTHQIGFPRFLAPIVNLPNIAGALNNLEKIGTIAILATIYIYNQDTTLH